MSDRLFPIQRECGAKAHPLLIPWSVAEKAYSVYSAQYGTDQSLERLAERGGFYPAEMDELFPAWRQETDITTRYTALCAALDRLEQAMRQTVKQTRGQHDVRAFEAAAADSAERWADQLRAIREAHQP